MSASNLRLLLQSMGNIWDNCVDLLDNFMIGGVSLWFISVSLLVLGLLFTIIHNLGVK